MRGNPRVRSKGLRKGREKWKKAKGKARRPGERLPRICNGGRWRAWLRIQKDGALAPVCSTNAAGISWVGLEGRKEATSGASRTVMKGLGVPGCVVIAVQAVQGDREKLGVLRRVGREALGKASECESFGLGQNDRCELKELRLRVWRNWLYWVLGSGPSGLWIPLGNQ